MLFEIILIFYKGLNFVNNSIHSLYIKPAQNLNINIAPGTIVNINEIPCILPQFLPKIDTYTPVVTKLISITYEVSVSNYMHLNHSVLLVWIMGMAHGLILNAEVLNITLLATEALPIVLNLPEPNLLDLVANDTILPVEVTRFRINNTALPVEATRFRANNTTLPLRIIRNPQNPQDPDDSSIPYVLNRDYYRRMIRHRYDIGGFNNFLRF
jgi:hypothetical protein